MVRTPRSLLHPAIHQEHGQHFETGHPVAVHYVRNTASAPKPFSKDRFQQKIEPHGRYLLHHPNPGKLPEGWERGKVTFRNPLVLAFNTHDDGPAYDETSWKARLRSVYKAKGAALSRKLAAAGHDGIVTVLTRRGRSPETSEIVDLTDYHRNKFEERTLKLHVEKQLAKRLSAQQEALGDALSLAKRGWHGLRRLHLQRKLGAEFGHASDLKDLAQRMRDAGYGNLAKRVAMRGKLSAERGHQLGDKAQAHTDAGERAKGLKGQTTRMLLHDLLAKRSAKKVGKIVGHAAGQDFARVGSGRRLLKRLTQAQGKVASHQSAWRKLKAARQGVAPPPPPPAALRQPSPPPFQHTSPSQKKIGSGSSVSPPSPPSSLSHRVGATVGKAGASVARAGIRGVRDFGRGVAAGVRVTLPPRKTTPTLPPKKITPPHPLRKPLPPPIPGKPKPPPIPGDSEPKPPSGDAGRWRPTIRPATSTVIRPPISGKKRKFWKVGVQR